MFYKVSHKIGETENFVAHVRCTQYYYYYYYY